MNFTARPGLDPTGLSTFKILEFATEPGKKAQVIDVSKLKVVVAVIDDCPPGHVSIRPLNASEIAEWAATRGKDPDVVHQFTKDIMQARIKEVRRPNLEKKP